MRGGCGSQQLDRRLASHDQPDRRCNQFQRNDGLEQDDNRNGLASAQTGFSSAVYNDDNNNDSDSGNGGGTASLSGKVATTSCRTPCAIETGGNKNGITLVDDYDVYDFYLDSLSPENKNKG
jgi:hypothetical protein